MSFATKRILVAKCLLRLKFSRKEQSKIHVFLLVKVIGRLLTKLVDEKEQIGMNIYLQFCFHIRLLTRWQHIIHPTS
jgi:hypothetical protein